MKKMFSAFLGLTILLGIQQHAHAIQQETPRLITAYDWGGLDNKGQAIYLAGALEGFFFSLYSAVDPTKREQIRGYNKLKTCVQRERAQIQRSFTTSLALGRDLEYSFADILWNQVVPLICEKQQSQVAGETRTPLRFVSHREWSQIPSSQKKLFLRGYLEAQLHLLTRQPDSQEKSQDLSLYAQVITGAGQERTLGLLDKHGLEPNLPIPWSIARANGSLAQRGPGYPTPSTAESRLNRTSESLVEGWMAWMDLEVVNAVCLEQWKKSNQQGFKESVRVEILRQHRCLADRIADPLLPEFFSELGATKHEIKAIHAQLSPTLIKEKTVMAKRHFSGLTGDAQDKLCAENWELSSSPANSPYFRAHQIQYDVTRIPKTPEARQLAESLVSICKLPAP
jgi:hypothetical protein